MRKCILVFCLISLGACMYGQDPPKVIPPTPAAMQYQKYGDYPVGNFTGIPDITIPLYTIKEGDLEVPITLSYHASGIKPDDPNGILGPGWVLNTGGIITRTQLAASDEVPFPDDVPFPTEQYITSLLSNPETLNTWKHVNAATGGNTEPDLFSYNFLGNNGKFIAKNYRSIGVPEFMLLDYKPLFIKANPGQTIRFYSFDIIDEDGRKFYFAEGSGNEGSATSGRSSWLLSKMTSATDATNEIVYGYVDGPLEMIIARHDTYNRDDHQNVQYVLRSCGDWYIEQWAEYMDNDYTTWDYTDDLSYQNVPSVINFRSGSVRFTYNAETKMLSGMTVYNKANEVIKRIEFTIYKKPHPELNATRPFLKEVKFFDRDSSYLNKYAFNYFQEDYEMPAPVAVGVDYWGYYSGPLAYSDLIPNYRFEFYNWYLNYMADVGTNPRQTSETNMKIYSLNEIIYPTGGKTVFEFEANKIPNFSFIPGYFSYDVGGLRIRRKFNYTADSKLAEVKEYEYSPGEMDIYPTKEYFTYTQQGHILDDYKVWESFRRMYVTSNPLVNIAPHGSPVVYSWVSEKTMGPNYESGIPLGVTRYDYKIKRYDNEYSFSTTNGPSNDYLYAYSRPYQSLIQPHNDGTVYSISTYGPKNEVNTTFYDYEEIPRESVAGFHSDKFVFYMNNPCPCDPSNGLPCMTVNPDRVIRNYGSTFYPWNFGEMVVTSSHKRLKKTVSIDFSNMGDLSEKMETVTEYAYENAIHDQPTKKTVTNSKGEIFSTTYKYPHDFPGQEPYATMVDRHIWSPVIEEKTTKEGSDVHLQTTKTNFGFWNGSSWVSSATNMIVPQMVEKKAQQYDQEERIRFDSYDGQGNITTVSKKNDIKMSYIWGYNKTLPIAEVANASTEQVAYTSFEENEFGNWSLKPGSSIVDGNIITGKKICSGGVTKTVPAGNYVVTAWVSDNCTVNGQAGTQLAFSKRNSNWRYLEWKLQNISTVDISGDNIDEVRLHPADAQMTTYTYDPLIGMTSKTDINNRISYYEYDAGGRLQHIRDEGYNILKKYQYAFQDNSETASGNRAPNWQYTGGYRDMPCPQDQRFIIARESEQIDANTTSTTYGQKRYINTGAFVEPGPEWEFTANYRCRVDFGQVTGEREREQKNVNPCSFDFGNTRWVIVETNSSECPRPAVFTNQEDLSGDFYSSQCNTPAEEPLPYYVSIPPGMITSTISPQDVVNKANAYGQQQADAHGGCRVLPININFSNNSSNGTEKFEIGLLNLDTDEEYVFTDIEFTRSLGAIAPGKYQVSIFPKSNSSTNPVTYEYFLGCNYSIVGGDIEVTNITFDYNCNTITVQ